MMKSYVPGFSINILSIEITPSTPEILVVFNVFKDLGSKVFESLSSTSLFCSSTTLISKKTSFIFSFVSLSTLYNLKLYSSGFIIFTCTVCTSFSVVILVVIYLYSGLLSSKVFLVFLSIIIVSTICNFSSSYILVITTNCLFSKILI
ncbi:unknown [Clostridium sp. CAG:571]|nr:unknown [Clostridium sp. CAG:571]